MYPCQNPSVCSGSASRSSSRLPLVSKRQTSTRVALAENSVKFVPRPSQIAPCASALPSVTLLRSTDKYHLSLRDSRSRCVRRTQDGCPEKTSASRPIFQIPIPRLALV